MVISKTPLRISFFGGGTDYPDYFNKHEGAVLSTSINKYVYVTLDKINPLSEYKYKLAYSKLESPNTIEKILHPSARACLKYMKIAEGMEIHIMNDLFALVDWEMHNMNIVDKEILNVGGGTKISVSLQELTKICEEVTGNKIPITTIAENRAADIPIYVTDNTKVTKFTGWKPVTSPQKIVQEIYHWIKDNQKDLENILR